MPNKYRYLLSFILISYPFIVSGQKSASKNKKDTIFVYETITIFDTIHVYDTVKVTENSRIEVIEPKALKILQLDTVYKRANLLVISKNQTATIPINSIILNENIKNLESMKKLGFFGVVLFAFQSMIMAQTDFGISAGSGIWWAKCNQSFIKSKVTPTFNAGLFVRHGIIHNKFAIGSALNFQYLMANNSYVTPIDPITREFPREGTLKDFFQISIPFNLIWNIGILKLFLGFEYAHRTPYYNFFILDGDNIFGFDAGLKYSISEKIIFGLSFYHEITKDFNLNTTRYNDKTSSSENINYYWRNNRINFSIYYTFKKNKPKE